MLKLKLADGIISPVCLVGGRFFLFTNAMDAHGGRLLGDGSFEHPRQMLKWMVLKVSPMLYTLFDQCDI